MNRESIIISLCLGTCIAMSSSIVFAEQPPTAVEAVEPESPSETVSPATAKVYKATSEQKSVIVKLCKQSGWNVSKTSFKTSGDWFLTGENLTNYQKCSEAVGLSGDYFSSALVGTKKYSNNGNPYYVTFVIALSDEDPNEIVGAFIIPETNKKSMNLKKMMSLSTSPSTVKKKMNKK